MQRTTKNILLSMIFLSPASLRIVANPGENFHNESVNDNTNKVVSGANNEVASLLIAQAFPLMIPSNGSFEASQEAFEKFNKERTVNNILKSAASFFGTEAEYYRALGKCAEKNQFPFLAALLYQKAHQAGSLTDGDVSGKLRELGIISTAQLLNGLNVHGQLVTNSKELFTKKDKNGESTIDHAKKIFAAVKLGFKDQEDFVKAVYEYQKNVGGSTNVAQLFKEHFLPSSK